ncbi:MAG: bifunctional homocysteine S-methyltransferase/methylenetetrahydrofolate reductase [Geobacter sp.]|nr:bifunctional homocysteine S-methyltransferase/methylenetetrahydrofolate reductase [Geobacter sp.]
MTFLERVKQELLVADGAAGTMFYARGVSLDANFEHLNLVRPELVLELHRDYIAAGAQLIETNTFGANFTKLNAIGLGHKVRAINLKGAQLAREAAQGEGVLVAGAMGPLPRVKGEERTLTASEVSDIFREQALALAEGGVDLLMLETFVDLGQLELALSAAKETGLPLVASMSFGENGRTVSGVAAEDAAVKLQDAGANVIGANCGSGPLKMLDTVRRLSRAISCPVAALPNSGFPEYMDGRFIYRATPEYFGRMAVELVQAGASLIGGCCGTTPEHIRQIAEQVRGMRPSSRQPMVAVSFPEAPAAAPVGGAGFLADWGKRPLVTVELDPPRGFDCRKVLEGSQALRDAGADAINLAENPLARVRMGNIALASLIQREVGIEVIVHVTCRDRNLIGLQSELMGASLLGIRSVLAVTGDPASIGEHAESTSVYDLNSFGLIKLLADLNRGLNAAGNPVGEGANFTIGAAFNPNVQKMEGQVRRLEKKVANGARFVQTQPIYDIQRLKEMLERTAHLGVPILPGILPLVSERNAEFLHNEVPGIVIPDEIRSRMRGKEKTVGVREGLEIAREFIAAARELVGGFYVIPPFGRFEIAVDLVKFIKEGE